MDENQRSVRSNPIALLPIIVFLVLYLGCGLLFEYGLNIEQGFYQTPAIVIFLIALAVACFQNRKLDFNAKLKVMANGVADENILTMCLVFWIFFPASLPWPACFSLPASCPCPWAPRWAPCPPWPPSPCL